jgi:hypothetical protein
LSLAGTASGVSEGPQNRLPFPPQGIFKINHVPVGEGQLPKGCGSLIWLGITFLVVHKGVEHSQIPPHPPLRIHICFPICVFNKVETGLNGFLPQATIIDLNNSVKKKVMRTECL